MKKILIVGGANGIGLALAHEMSQKQTCDKIYIVDKVFPSLEHTNAKMECFLFDLTNDDYSIFNQFDDIDTLIITAGFGRLSLFKDIDEDHICNSFKVNAIAPIRIIHHFINKIQSNTDFYCGVMVSIAGFISSPLFAVYGATKAALKIFIESLNVELEKNNSINRILNVSPGHIKGTSFYNDMTDLNALKYLAQEIIMNLEIKNDLLIPKYEEIFKEVLTRYQQDFRAEGKRSYEYKTKNRL